ncbi:hypothetical protein TSUD_205370 [Trifolium subterraneum]|uniref:Uncharacterized protein n=1 Tax=Trifolium subterraneum TaxID=3900 RepID=A0A2Z6P6C9_TRISU|nr:hypothetical protein TSUD_205370 [Trifolium subterraneum]
MAQTNAFLVLVLLVVAILNGYSVEGAGRGNHLEKDDPVYKSQKATPSLWMQNFLFWDPICARCENDPTGCLGDYLKWCPNKDLQPTAAKTDDPKAENLP